MKQPRHSLPSVPILVSYCAMPEEKRGGNVCMNLASEENYTKTKETHPLHRLDDERTIVTPKIVC